MTKTNDKSMRATFMDAAQDTPSTIHPEDKLECRNCGSTFEGIELLLDVHGCVRCPDCASSELVTYNKHKELWFPNRCPKCLGHALAVVVSVWSVLTENGSETDHDDCPDHDHEWDPTSAMKCLDCGFSWVALDFDPEKETL